MHRIRTRLIAAFVLVALLPAIPLSIVAGRLIERSFGPLMDEGMMNALKAGLEESRERLRAEKERFQKEVEEDWLEAVLRGERRQGTAPVEEGGVALLAAGGAGGEGSAHLPMAGEELLRWAGGARTPAPGGLLDEPERVSNRLVQMTVTAGGEKILFVKALPADVSARAEKIVEAVGLLEALRLERRAVVRSYVVPFVLAYALLLVAAVLLGARLAKWIAGPVESLVAGTKRVAEGDWDARVSLSGAGEVRDLEEAFNRMVGRLSTQKKELARLERKAAWRNLARTLAHEIKNPLTPIQLAVQEAGDRYGGDDEEYRRLLGECVEIVNEEVGSLRALVREFSEFARLPEPKPEEGDLAPLVGEVARLYGPDKVDVRGPSEGIRARFDGEEIRRALINLVENGLAACRAAAREEKVRIGLERVADQVRIEVADEGTGIPEEHRRRIFEPHFTTKREGMGLGLAIVEGIVTAHGGTIAVESDIGKGTVFRISLPVEGPRGKNG